MKDVFQLLIARPSGQAQVHIPHVYSSQITEGVTMKDVFQS